MEIQVYSFLQTSLHAMTYTTFQKSWVSQILNTFNCMQKGCIKLIKSANKDIYKVSKDLYFKQMLLVTVSTKI